MSTNKIQQATVGFSGNFDVLAAGPMDAKTRAAATVGDLIKEETWASRDNNCYIYNGLMAILDDGSVYVLTDASKYQEQASWKKVGSDVEVDTSSFVQKTGDEMSGSLIFKGNSGKTVISIDQNTKSITTSSNDSIHAKKIVLDGDNSIINADGLSYIKTNVKNVAIIGYSVLLNCYTIDEISTDSAGKKNITLILSGSNYENQTILREIAFLTDNAYQSLKFRLYDDDNSGIYETDVNALQVSDFYYSTGQSEYVVEGTYTSFSSVKDYVKSSMHGDIPELTFKIVLSEKTSGAWNRNFTAGDVIDLIYPNTLTGVWGEMGSVLLGKSNVIDSAHHAIAQGFGNIVESDQGSAWGKLNHITSNAQNAHVEGYYNEVSDKQAHAEGARTKASAENAHAEGEWTGAHGKNSHAEGYGVLATGQGAHAEGYFLDSKGDNEVFKSIKNIQNSIALDSIGYPVLGAQGKASHIEGIACSTGLPEKQSDGSYKLRKGFEGKAAHAQGSECKAYGNYSFAGGQKSITYGAKSLAFGANCTTGSTTTPANNSIALGDSTKTTSSEEFACGKFNKSNEDVLFTVGNGTGDDNRSNAFQVNTTGTATVAADPVNDMDVVTKRYVDSLSSNCITLDYNSITDPIKKELVTQKDLEQVLSSFFIGRSGVHTAQQFECYKNISNKDIISQLNLILTGIVKRVTLKVYDGDLGNYSFVPTTIIFPTDAQFNNGGRDENASCLIAGWGIGGTDGVITSSSTQHGTRSALVGNYNTIYDSQQGTAVSTYGGLNPILYCIYVKRTVTENANTGGYDYSDYIIYKGTITSEDERVGIWGGT